MDLSDFGDLLSEVDSKLNGLIMALAKAGVIKATDVDVEMFADRKRRDFGLPQARVCGGFDYRSKK